MKILNKILLFILILSFTSSCIVKKTSTTDANTVIIDDKPSTKASDNETKPDKVVKETISSTKTDTVKYKASDYKLKSEYNVAIIMPLLADSINHNWNEHFKPDLKDFNIPYASKISLDFIEAAMLALENLDLKSKINIKIYDNEASTSRTNLILKKLDVESVDFIFGPMLKQNITLVSEFAKKNNITMISPFSPSKSASSNHTKYIMADPSLDSHFNAMTKFIADSMSRNSIKIVYPTSENNKKYANAIQAMFASINDSLPANKKLKYKLVELSDKSNGRNFKVSEHLDTDKPNTFIVVSFNEGFVHNILTDLSLVSKSSQVTVFGMPNWKESKTLRLDYFNKLNVHYTDSKWINEEDEKTIAFETAFKEKYKTIPSSTAYLAFDLFSFFPLMMDKYGLNLDANIQNEKFEGVLNTYHFETLNLDIEAEGNTSNRIENTNIRIISYDNYKLILKK